jgi:hypothetical protein
MASPGRLMYGWFGNAQHQQVSATAVGDPEPLVPGSEAEFIAAAPGLPRQRNAIIAAAAAEGCDALLFLDDDFLPAPDYLAVTEAVLAQHPGCVVTTGTVLADGAKGPGISPEQGRALIMRDQRPQDVMAVTPHFNGYGCNMAIRLAPALEHELRFDEALPLYAWYEDIDFTRALGRHGTILRLAGARGVHLGTKAARTPGVRLGYSQVVNPVYLARKGTFPWNHAIPACPSSWATVANTMGSSPRKFGLQSAAAASVPVANASGTPKSTGATSKIQVNRSCAPMADQTSTGVSRQQNQTSRFSMAIPCHTPRIAS